MRGRVRPEPVIPDHEVLRKIGGGSYGEVWLARGVTGAMRAVVAALRSKRMRMATTEFSAIPCAKRASTARSRTAR